MSIRGSNTHFARGIFAAVHAATPSNIAVNSAPSVKPRPSEMLGLQCKIVTGTIAITIAPGDTRRNGQMLPPPLAEAFSHML